jgi:LuxR family transcriptional regulator, glucitol operon activator
LGPSTQEEKVATVIVQAALEKYQSGRYLEAMEDYRRARDIAPRFASVYRSWAAMEASEGHQIEADKLLEKAAELSPGDAQIWLTWGNIKKGAGRIKDAKQYYERALALRPDDEVIMHGLAKVKTWLGEYSEAEDLLKLASRLPAVSSSWKQEIVNRSCLADNCARWAEQLRTQRRDKEAEAKFKEALSHCERVVQLDEADPRSRDLLRDVLIRLGHFYKRSYPRIAITYFLRAIADNPSRYAEARDTIVASLYAAKTLASLGDVDQARRIFTPRLVKMHPLKSHPKLQDECQALLHALYPTNDKQS